MPPLPKWFSDGCVRAWATAFGLLDFLHFIWLCTEFKVRRFAAKKNPERKYKAAFVTTWFGKDITGGAEAECFGLAKLLQERPNGITVEILTSGLLDFSADWNGAHHPLGVSDINGLLVRRFAAKRTRRRFFHLLNGRFLMPGGTEELHRSMRSPLNIFEEFYFIKRMVYCPELYRYIASHINDYSYVVFIPYMFAGSFYGSLAAAGKSAHIPCLHDERYAFMRIYRWMLKRAEKVFFHVKSERALALSLCQNQIKVAALIGEQVHTAAPEANPEGFKQKYHIKFPYILYAGRKISGKNLPLLVNYFKQYKQQHPSAIKLVVIGRGDLDYRGEQEIVDLGFVSAEEKFMAYSGALALCQPSLNESFSIVMMEAWLQKTPVIVHGGCAVTRDHVMDAKGGWVFTDQGSFNQALEDLLINQAKRTAYGENGRGYVLRNYTPDIVLERVEALLKE